MNVLVESMTKLVFESYTIRCWRQETGTINDWLINRNLEDIYNTIQYFNYDSPITYIASTILKLDRMNAVEVLDNNGNGCVVYKDWP